jgi:hypothetical protein
MTTKKPNNQLHRFLIALLCTFLVACSTTDNGNVVHVIPTPSSGKALLIFYREFELGGSVVWFGIRDNGNEIGRLSNATFFRYEAAPGTHVFSASSETTERKIFPVEAGKTYYLRCAVRPGLILAEPHLILVDSQEGASAVVKLKQKY